MSGGISRITRRGALALVAAFFARLANAADTPRDQGIGGTGVVAGSDETDRGIGGTGFIGAIQRFGSIFVNGARIAHPADAKVFVDDEPAALDRLRIGQVVRVIATRRGHALWTNAIDVTSEVVGPVESVAIGALRVLGQTVLTPQASRFATGERIAVYGLRRPDGGIIASLVERRSPGPSRVAGPARDAGDGRIAIGDLIVAGADASLAGQRIVAEGEFSGGELRARRAVVDLEAFAGRVRRLSIETFVVDDAQGFRTGSGFAVTGGESLHGSGGEQIRRAVLDVALLADGALEVIALHPERSGGGASGGPGGPGPGGPGAPIRGVSPGRGGPLGAGGPPPAPSGLSPPPSGLSPAPSCLPVFLALAAFQAPASPQDRSARASTLYPEVGRMAARRIDIGAEKRGRRVRFGTLFCGKNPHEELASRGFANREPEPQCGMRHGVRRGRRPSSSRHLLRFR